MGGLLGFLGGDTADEIDKSTGDLKGYGENKEAYNDLSITAGSGMQGAQADAAQARGQQMQLASMLQNAAMGNGPSAAQAQLQAGNDASMRQGLAMAASSRPQDAALAYHQAAFQGAQAAQNNAAQAAQLRAQEMQQAQGAYGGLLSGVRGQDAQNQQLQSQMMLQGMQGRAAQDQAATNQFTQYQQMLDTARGRDQAAGMSMLSGAMGMAGGAMSGGML